LPVECPNDCRPGDVLQVRLPPTLKMADDSFLTRLAAAEQHERERSSPVYGWRINPQGQTLSRQTASPYATEQQRTQLLMREAHHCARARQQQRESLQRAEQSAAMASGAYAAMEYVGRNAEMLARRPTAAQRKLMAAKCQQVHSSRSSASAEAAAAALAAARSSQGQKVRAPNVAMAQHEASLLARQQQASRDPRGRAFTIDRRPRP
jgi:hypothetical protein